MLPIEKPQAALEDLNETNETKNSNSYQEHSYLGHRASLKGDKFKQSVDKILQNKSYDNNTKLTLIMKLRTGS